MNEVILEKDIINKNNYPKIIDIEFKYLLKENEEEEIRTVDDFFSDYDRLFFEIPLEGEFNSHRELIKRSTEYIGEEINSDKEDLLLEEINQLRLELLESRQIIENLTK
jgi:hypothetical protein